MRIARLFVLLLLVLGATVLSAANKPSGLVRKGGMSGPATMRTTHRSTNKMAGADSWWCNDGHASGSCDGMYDCMDQCMANCGPPCTWYGDLSN